MDAFDFLVHACARPVQNNLELVESRAEMSTAPGLFMLICLAGCVVDGKPSLTVLISDDLVATGLNATNIAREAAKEIQGGGGQPFFASAGGKNPAGIQKAVKLAFEALK